MGTPKAHHFVPRFYLEGFVDREWESKGKSVLWVYQPDKGPRKSSPENVAFQNYLYAFEENGKTNVSAELAFQRFEDKAKPVLDKLRRDDINLTEEERNWFTMFLALSAVRVPSALNMIDEEMRENRVQLGRLAEQPGALEEYCARLDELAREEGVKLSGSVEEFRQDIQSGKFDLLAPLTRLRAMFGLARFLLQRINDYHWTIGKRMEDADFLVTSDNPVALYDPNAPLDQPIGWGSSLTVEFTFPLDRDRCLHATWHGREGVGSILNKDVRNVNRRTMRSAFREVYSPVNSDRLYRAVNRHCGALARLH